MQSRILGPLALMPRRGHRRCRISVISLFILLLPTWWGIPANRNLGLAPDCGIVLVQPGEFLQEACEKIGKANCGSLKDGHGMAI